MGTALDRLRPPSSREAIVNSLVAAKTMRGINDGTFSALLRHRLREVLGKYNRLAVKGPWKDVFNSSDTRLH
jgi:hypothetical protein